MADRDPYWESFINRPPADPNNLITHALKQVRPGGVNPVRTEVHSPNVMSRHVKELAQFYGADQVGIVSLASGQLFAIYTLGSYIRELGYNAVHSETDRERLAAAAGLGSVDAAGRLVTRKFGARCHVADVLLTDLPLAADGRA